jgi:hypothetical protein
VLGGVPRRGIYDNMRTAVDKVGRGKERQVNVRFSGMVSHFLFEAEFCNPASGWEKGQIEKNVQDARHRLWQPMPDFPSLAALNDWLETRCRELWAQTLHGSQPGAIVDVWAEEVGRLMQLSRPFDGFVEYAPSACRRRAWSTGAAGDWSDAADWASGFVPTSTDGAVITGSSVAVDGTAAAFAIWSVDARCEICNVQVHGFLGTHLNFKCPSAQTLICAEDRALSRR